MGGVAGSVAYIILGRSSGGGLFFWASGGGLRVGTGFDPEGGYRVGTVSKFFFSKWP